MSNLIAVQQAHHHWINHEHYDKQQQYDAAVELGEWGLYSNRQIAVFTGLRRAVVDSLNPKSNKSGGTLAPEALPHIEQLIVGVRTPETIKATLDAGVSTTMLARLSGISGSMISRWARKATTEKVAA